MSWENPAGDRGSGMPGLADTTCLGKDQQGKKPWPVQRPVVCRACSRAGAGVRLGGARIHGERQYYNEGKQT